MNIQAVENNIGYIFKNKELLKKALTHSSKGGKEFQRLEFLGDRVLNISLTLLLLEDNKTASEGKLAKRLAVLGSAKCLHEVALMWELDTSINCTPIQVTAILSDACEAVLGAIFLDCDKDLKVTIPIVQHFWEIFLKDSNDYDPKTRLQEIAYKLYKVSPEYETILLEGKDHRPLFGSTVKVFSKKGKGIGGSIKEAEKAAASDVLKKMV